MEGGNKCLCIVFLADQKIVSSWKKCVLGHPIAQATSYCLLPDAFRLWASKNVFKVGSVKFTVTTFHCHCEESTHQSKSSQGT